MNLNELKRNAARSARELLMLRPYLMGRCLRMWYLRKLLAHYEISARVERYLSDEHTRTAEHFDQLARGVESELDAFAAPTES